MLMMLPARCLTMCGGYGVYVVESRFQIDVQHQIPLLFRHAKHERIARNAGVVDQNIYATEFANDFFLPLGAPDQTMRRWMH